MSYKIIVDSCGELTEEMKSSGCFETASLEIDVNGYHIVDDEKFDQALFLKYVAEAPDCPKSSCPSPERYMAGYNCEAERVYAVTLSAEERLTIPRHRTVEKIKQDNACKIAAVHDTLQTRYNCLCLPLAGCWWFRVHSRSGSKK